MRLRFIGLEGSMGLRFGKIYRLTVHPWHNGVRITSPIICPYDSEDSFWRNWCHPDVELRVVMERKGKDLRELHLPDAVLQNVIKRKEQTLHIDIPKEK